MYANLARHFGRNEFLLMCLRRVEYSISLFAGLQPLLPGPPPCFHVEGLFSRQLTRASPPPSPWGPFTCSLHRASCHQDSMTSSSDVSVLVCGGCVFQELSENEYEEREDKSQAGDLEESLHHIISMICNLVGSTILT